MHMRTKKWAKPELAVCPYFTDEAETKRGHSQTARMYGYLHAGIWTIMPAMEELVEIRKPYLHVGVDYENTETILHGQIGVSARLGTLLRAALSAGIPAIRWFLQHRKNMSAPTQAAA